MQLLLHDNPTRVLTNSPTFPWQTHQPHQFHEGQAVPTHAITCWFAPGAGELKLGPSEMGMAGFGLPAISARLPASCAWCSLPKRRDHPTTKAAVGNLFHISTTSTIPIGVARAAFRARRK